MVADHLRASRLILFDVGWRPARAFRDRHVRRNGLGRICRRDWHFPSWPSLGRPNCLKTADWLGTTEEQKDSDVSERTEMVFG
jgi:hypothetical protein